MLKAIDKLWFKIQDHIKGYNAGYDHGYTDGKVDGRYELMSYTVHNLRKKELNHISDSSFKLGYEHAIAVVREEI